MITDVAQGCGYILLSKMLLRKGIKNFIKASCDSFNNSVSIPSIPSAFPTLSDLIAPILPSFEITWFKAWESLSLANTYIIII